MSSKEKKKKFAKEFVRVAEEKELKVVAITDHNFCKNLNDLLIPYIQEEASTKGITILPGFELEVSDLGGIHVLVIFPEDTDLEAINDIVSALLPVRFTQRNEPKATSYTLDECIRIIQRFQKEGRIKDFLIAFAHADGEKGILKAPQGNIRADVWKRKEVRLCQLSKAPVSYEASYEIGIRNIIDNKDGNYRREEKLAYFLASDCRSLYPVNSLGRYALGEKYTWIKAAPTFAGLKQALTEPEERFAYDEPELLKRLRNYPEKFIKYLCINWKENYKGEEGVWFKDVKIPFNPGLVTIIGNKGNGKSAIVDILALCGGAKVDKGYFSFLNEKRFCRREGKKGRLSDNFVAKLVWQNGEEQEKCLSDIVDESEKERVKYLPQGYFEKLASDPLALEEFQDALEKIVFEHLPPEKKHGKRNLKEIIAFLTEKIREEVQSLKERIRKLNEAIVELEERESPEYLHRLTTELQFYQGDLKECEEKIGHLEKEKQRIGQDSEKEVFKRLEKLERERRKLEEKIGKLKGDFYELSSNVEELGTLVERIKERLESFHRELIWTYGEELKKFGIKLENIVSISFNPRELEKALEERKKRSLDVQKLINDLEEKKSRIMIEKEELQAHINKIKSDYRRIIIDLEVQRKKKEELLKKIEDLDKEINFIKKELPQKKLSLQEERLKIAVEIFKKKKEEEEFYSSLKREVDKRIEEYKDLLEKYGYEISLDVSIVVNKERFIKEVFNRINKRAKGNLKGDGEEYLKELLEEYDFSSEGEIESFLRKFINILNEIPDEGKKLYPLEQMKGRNHEEKKRNLKELYNYVFNPADYLEVRYQLQLGQKDLNLLSPGERGAILLVFHLLLDKEDIPLIMDQPEENLDNESIYEVLVKLIKDVRKRRQVIIVTHNPNLAITTDADQIIRVKIDRLSGNKFSYKSGPIENYKIRKAATDILEGTLQAFEKRREKYSALP